MSRRRKKAALACAWFCMLMAAAPAASAVPLVPPDLDRSGRTVTTDNGSTPWVPAATGYTYAWFRCTSVTTGSCTQVPGASGASYVLRTADIGFRIRSRVTGTGSGSAFSEPPGDPITASPPVNTVRPVVTGTPRVGLRLGTTTGTWSGRVAGDPPFKYQWQRCTPSVCSGIPGSAGATHLLGPSDLGLFIRSVIVAEGLGTATAPSTGLAGPVQAATAAQSAKRLSPFPVVAIAGRIKGRITRVSGFVVRGPRRAKVSLRCRGRGCPFSRITGTIGKRKRLRFRRAQRTYRAGQVLEIRVTGRDRIGKFTRIRFRRGRAPRRVDSCLMPSVLKPSPCQGA